MKYLDDHPNVIWWGSEELVIPYWSPVDNKKHRYFPDFVAKIRQKNGVVKTFVIEVKPEAQTKPPIQKRKTQRYIQEAATYVINQSKWKAATEFCKDHGWEFQVLTEKHLGI
jgi:predicted TIM-barrel fold metal-dependent hydrolase